MSRIKTLLIIFVLAFAVFASSAQLSDSDLVITEMYNANFPTDSGTITLVEGVSGDYQLLSYSVLGELDEAEGRDAAVILVQETEEGLDYYLYAVLSEQSFPNPVAYTFLGTEIAILNLTVNEGAITVDFVAEGENDSIMTSRKTFALDGTALNIVFDGDLEEGHPFLADDILSVEELSNITYALDYFDYPVALVDGTATNLIGNTEQSWNFVYTLDTEHIAYGDLNGDGLEDAVVYLNVAIEGTTDNSWVIAAVLNKGGLPQFADSEVDRLGWGAELQELSISEDGLITFRFMEQTHQQEAGMSWVLRDGILVAP